MSSTGLPTLTIDVTTRRGERFIAGVVLLLVITAVLQLQHPVATLALIAACALMSVAGGCMMLGWIGGDRRIARIVCQPDGRWVLCEASGRTVEHQLSGASRASNHAVWLQWQGTISRPLLLLSGDIPAADFRRLVMRLRLTRTQTRNEQDES
jgi:hypothetical protein